jgi:tricorn protease
MNPVWSPDGKSIAYLSDKTGEYEVYTRPQMGGADTRITSDGGAYRYGPVWSPDSKKLLYWDKLHKLWWVSVEERKPVQVDQGDYGDISDGSWSPDSAWIAYSKADRRQAGQMYLYALDQRKATKISNGFYNDTNPVFDPDGKYIFFLSQRYFFPSTGQLDQRFSYYTTDGIFSLTLKSDEASPFKPESDEEKAADKDKDRDQKDDKAAAAKKDDAKAAKTGKDEAKKDEKTDE